MGLFQIFNDREGLGESMVPIHQRRHQGLWINGDKRGRELLAATSQQVHAGKLVRQALQIERDPRPERGRADRITIEFHRDGSPPISLSLLYCGFEFLPCVSSAGLFYSGKLSKPSLQDSRGQISSNAAH